MNQTVLIAGATGSIGGAAATALADRGTRVVLLGRKLDRLEARADRIRTDLGGNTPEIESLVIDFSDMESVRSAAAEAQSRFPTIDGLVLSVGALVQNGPNVLDSGHELMFASNVMGPFLFTELLHDRLAKSQALVLHVIAPYHHDLDWDDLESIKRHKSMDAFNRTKTCNRVIAGELARRYPGEISSVAFDPTFVIDKSDPTLSDRWPSGFTGIIWRVMTKFRAKHPSVAGEPIARLMLDRDNRETMNGSLYVLDERSKKPNEAMNDRQLGKRLWAELERMTDLKTSTNVEKELAPETGFEPVTR